MDDKKGGKVDSTEKQEGAKGEAKEDLDLEDEEAQRVKGGAVDAFMKFTGVEGES
jgi:hypothetical protein